MTAQVAQTTSSTRPTGGSGRPVWQEKPHAIVQGFKIIILAFSVIVMLYPFVHVISVSFSNPADYTPGDLLLWPKGFTTAAYKLILAGGIVPRALLVSVGITVGGTLLSMFMTVTLAYGLSQTRRVPGSRFVLYMVLLSMLFSAGVIPNYLLVRSLGLLNNYLSLILPGAISAFNLVVIRNFFMSIPEELLDAARMYQDSATHPVSRRAVLGLGIGGAGAALAGCSNAGRGVQDTGSGTDLKLPISMPRPAIEGTTLSKVPGVPPAYSKLPLPGFASVPTPPGKGGVVTSFTITWGAPPTPLDQNPWHQAINKALGTNLSSVIVPAQSFGDKLVTTIASGDIPDITTNEPSYRGRGARKYLPQGVFHDLRNFLGGDKVKKYIPTLPWFPSTRGRTR